MALLNQISSFKNISVKELVEKAIDCDNYGRLLEAQSHYSESIEMLINLALNETNEEIKNICLERMQQYANRRDQIQSHVYRLAANAKLLDQITIAENATGRSYRSLFGKYLNGHVREILIEETDPFQNEELQNFISFMELVVKNCKNLTFIKLCVPEVKNDPLIWESLLAVKRDLGSRNINLHFNSNKEVAENRILLSNGYIIKSTWGLNFYKTYEVLCLGINDYDFRKCKLNEITVWKTRPILG